MYHLPCLTVTSALIITAAVVHGNELVTDRPDATESSSVVQPGYTQLELGWLLTEAGETQTHELPQTLIRLGITERAELRVGWSGYLDSNEGATASGVGDGEVGTKVYLLEEHGLRPEVALLAGISLPWGDNDVSSDEVDPNFRFAFSHTLSERLSLGYNLGTAWTTEDNATESSFIYTIALGFGLTESLGLYVESFGDIGLSADGETHSIDGGLTYLLHDNLQLDVLAGIGINHDADDWFVGAGVSYRFPD